MAQSHPHSPSFRAPFPGRPALDVPFVAQDAPGACGAACLAMASAHWGMPVPLPLARLACGVTPRGCSALDIVRAAQAWGLLAFGARLSADELRETGLFPCIAHLDGSHFVLLRGFQGEHALVSDPARGELAMPLQEFALRYEGVCIQVLPAALFLQENRERPSKLTSQRMRRHVRRPSPIKKAFGRPRP